jgi:DNA-binding response OmpR family regulator
MNGHRLADILRAERSGLSVLLVSGYFDADKSGVARDPLMHKPFTPDALVEMVRSVLRKARRSAS